MRGYGRGDSGISAASVGAGPDARRVGGCPAIQNPEIKTQLLSGLARRLVELNLPADAVTAARCIDDEWSKPRCYPRWHPDWSRSTDQTRLWRLRAIEGRKSRDGTLSALARQLAESGHLAKALEAAGDIIDEWQRCEALTVLARRLTPAVLPMALQVARGMTGMWTRAQAEARLAPRLVELDHPSEALKIARTIKDPKTRAEILADLTGGLDSADRERALRGALAAAQVGVDRGRPPAEALATLAPP